MRARKYRPPGEPGVRAAELERRIGGEWLHYAIVEAVVIGIPGFGFWLAYIASGGFSQTVLVIAAVVLGLAITTLVLYFLFARIRPLQRELEEVRKVERVEAATRIRIDASHSS
jgi:hypothetical protein